jgi:hypothetical protein
VISKNTIEEVNDHQASAFRRSLSSAHAAPDSMFELSPSRIA